MNMCVGNLVYLVCDYSFCKDLLDWLMVERYLFVEGQGEGWGFFSYCICNFLFEKKKIYIFLCNFENINFVFNKSYVVFVLYFGISEIKC